jgi:hypothetical protein
VALGGIHELGDRHPQPDQHHHFDERDRDYSRMLISRSREIGTRSTVNQARQDVRRIMVESTNHSAPRSVRIRSRFGLTAPSINVRRSTSKMTAVDQPNSSTPFIAVIGPRSRQRSTGVTSP